MSRVVSTSSINVRFVLLVSAFSTLILAVLVIVGCLRYKFVISAASVSRFEILERVDIAVSNFLSNLKQTSVPFIPDKNPVSSSSSYPSFYYDPEIGFFSDYRGTRFCVKRGVVFQAGDFCEFGLITMISDSRLYCLSPSNSLVVVASSVANDAPNADRPARN